MPTLQEAVDRLTGDITRDHPSTRFYISVEHGVITVSVVAGRDHLPLSLPSVVVVDGLGAVPVAWREDAVAEPLESRKCWCWCC